MARLLADLLGGEVDVVLVHKLRAPMQPELAIGSVDEAGHVYLTDYARALSLPERYIELEKQAQMKTLIMRRRQYTSVHPPIDPGGRIVIVVDDGIATGSTMLAALRSIRSRNPERLIAATAVAPLENLEKIRPFADEVVCLETPEDFDAVGQFFGDFPQVTDEEAVELLARKVSAADPEVQILVDGKFLAGNLTVPVGAGGIVLFAHGSGSSRHSPRNRYVAEVLQAAKIGTLLFDLLTPEEDRIYETRFNIDLLSQRLITATQWLTRQETAAGLSLGYFGASTGAAAALMAAAKLGSQIHAVVSRGGRPDLAGPALSRVVTPTLLIVGGLDDVVIGMNRSACDRMTCVKKLEIVSGATHLFEEPGTLEEVAGLATDWFRYYLKADRSLR